MTPIPIQSSEDMSQPDLVSLGVTDSSKSPSSSNFPSKFSAHGFSIWHTIVVSNDYKEFCDFNPHPLERWMWVLKKYFVVCEHSVIFPFKISGEQSKSDIAVFMLSLARRHLKKYFKQIGLFKKISILTSSRRYILKPKAFEIEITANLYPIEDPTFYDWLMQHPPGPMFRTNGRSRQLQRLLYKTPDSQCMIHFNLSYMKHPRLTVNIEFNSPIVLPFHGKPLTKEYIHRYIEENIWVPLVRTHRFDDAGWRLF